MKKFPREKVYDGCMSDDGYTQIGITYRTKEYLDKMRDYLYNQVVDQIKDDDVRYSSVGRCPYDKLIRMLVENAVEKK